MDIFEQYPQGRSEQCNGTLSVHSVSYNFTYKRKWGKKLKILSFYPTKTNKLVLEFEDGTYRLFNIRNILSNPNKKIEDLQYNCESFLTVSLDPVTGTVSWENGIEFNAQMLFEQSVNLENLTNIREFTRTKQNTTVTEAIILLKDTIIICKELIDTYKSLLEEDNADEEERKEAEKVINKLEQEISSYLQAVSILEAKQRIEDEKTK